MGSGQHCAFSWQQGISQKRLVQADNCVCNMHRSSALVNVSLYDPPPVDSGALGSSVPIDGQSLDDLEATSVDNFLGELLQFRTECRKVKLFLGDVLQGWAKLMADPTT